MNSIRFVAIAALVAGVVAAQQGELKLDDVVRKSIEAQGGLDKMRAIKTMKVSGKMILGGGQIEAPMVSYMKRPQSNRTEIIFQGQKIVEGFDGTTKWSVNPMAGGLPQKANEEDTRAALDGSDVLEGPLVGYKEKGHTLELLGKEDVGGSMAFKIKVTLKSGSVRTVYVDATSFLTVRTLVTVSRMGQQFEAETLPGNYKSVDGVMIAFSSEMKVNKQVGMQLQFDKVEVNVPLEESLFSMPEMKKVEPPKAQL